MTSRQSVRANLSLLPTDLAVSPRKANHGVAGRLRVIGRELEDGALSSAADRASSPLPLNASASVSYDGIDWIFFSHWPFVDILSVLSNLN
jgi:hypothetical protein